jgi:hypothetical protein
MSNSREESDDKLFEEINQLSRECNTLQLANQVSKHYVLNLVL